jgi:peptidoglycan/xylan/chitin deacetylase (PgdA/CDA1 family)
MTSVRKVLVAVLFATFLVVATGVPTRAAEKAPEKVAEKAPEKHRRCAGTIALTFDDGPNPVHTPRLMRILLARQVPATFFMVGSLVKQYPGLTHTLQRRGFGIANHSWSHAELPALSSAAVRRQMQWTTAAFRAAGVRPSRLMRPPYGAVDHRVRVLTRQLGMKVLLWTVDSNDWRGGSSGAIAGRILSQLRPHQLNVVLQHDGVWNSAASVAAVPVVIAKARQRGYCFVALHGTRPAAAPTTRPSGTAPAPAKQTTVRPAAVRRVAPMTVPGHLVLAVNPVGAATAGYRLGTTRVYSRPLEPADLGGVLGAVLSSFSDV